MNYFVKLNEQKPSLLGPDSLFSRPEPDTIGCNNVKVCNFVPVPSFNMGDGLLIRHIYKNEQQLEAGFYYYLVRAVFLHPQQQPR